MNKVQRIFLSETLGTFLLVFIGCGTAMTVGCAYVLSTGYLITALAFGAAMAIAVYLFGDISGCHINPAVSVAMYLDKRINKKELGLYVIGQFLGAFLASGVLATIFSCSKLVDQTGCLGANSLGGVGNNAYIGLLVEIVLTAIFVMFVLKVTDKRSNTGALTGVLIGVALASVHFLGIGLTGTGVNPARSFGPALLSLLCGYSSKPMADFGTFLLGGLLGAVGAYYLYSILYNPRKNVRKEVKYEPKHERKEDFKEYFSEEEKVEEKSSEQNFEVETEETVVEDPIEVEKEEGKED